MEDICNDYDCCLQAEWVLEDKAPPEAWPQHGVVQFDNYSTRYRPGLDLVLSHISCQVNSGEKVCME